MDEPIVHAEVFTDGSCHTQHLVGGWASIILLGSEKIVLSGKQTETTHNRMELLAVIESINYIKSYYKTVLSIKIISDSQYVIGLVRREQKFIAGNYLTKKGDPVRNSDLVKQLIDLINTNSVEFIKIKAHQQKTDATKYNIEADTISRYIVRAAVKENTTSF